MSDQPTKPGSLRRTIVAILALCVLGYAGYSIYDQLMPEPRRAPRPAPRPVVNQPPPKPRAQPAAMIAAIRASDLDGVREQIERGIQIDQVFYDSRVPYLCWASFHGDERIVAALLECRPNLELHGPGNWTALMYAASRGHAGVVKQLLDAGANVMAENQWGRTALDFARERGHDSVVKLLVDAGAERLDIRELSALVTRGGAQRVKAALDANPQKITGRNERGDTLLHEATQSYQKASVWAEGNAYRMAVIKVLLEHGADLNARNNAGNTPAMEAAGRGFYDLAAFYVERGVDLTIRNNDQHTLLEVAQAGKEDPGRDAFIKLLQDRAATAP
jgi:ankyrin repeat protein